MTSRNHFAAIVPAGLSAALASASLAGCAVPGRADRAAGVAPAHAPATWDAVGARNPLIPGYLADPSIVEVDGEYFLFATLDPWGGDRLGLWRSRNGRDWTFSMPDWPSKSAARSATANDGKVWAPSVVQGVDGRYWMYVSIGSEVWVGVADHPAGPWRDANGGRPLIPGDFRPGFHMIDAEAFVDDDGQAYLYWGSGLKWVNGHCFVVKLKPDMVSFDGEVQDITPAHYFEAPFMFKANGHYFLTYSHGNTTKDTYQVRYAVGTSPMGPFTEPEDRPILATDAGRSIISPGHHAIFRAGGQPFILYHRQALPFPREDDRVLRQINVDRLVVDGDRLAVVEPTHGGPDVPGAAPRRRAGLSARLSAAGNEGDANRAGDDNYATAWQAQTAGANWLTADLGAVVEVGPSELRPALVAEPFRLLVEASADGQNWRTIMPERSVEGSPFIIPAAGRARYLRLRLPQPTSLLEWQIFAPEEGTAADRSAR
ncbi:family 43 glycosylhydrolase [Croceibacterium ferulae]|uniref:family 43 glycosylhydrolase n=1 Tax=Croceibacterium ferulae TaxID=1854641 RepID=UPI000EB268C8|nr:family 43 glycosylhydrolase [Croceibacterium ferulae]